MENICQEHQERYNHVKYCAVCSYERENDLLKERIEELNNQLLKAYENRDTRG